MMEQGNIEELALGLVGIMIIKRELNCREKPVKVVLIFIIFC